MLLKTIGQYRNKLTAELRLYDVMAIQDRKNDQFDVCV